MKAYPHPQNGTTGKLLRAFSAAAVMVGLILGIIFYRSVTYLQRVTEDRWELWVAVAKGLQGPVYYVGSENGYAYFRVGRYCYEGYKMPSSSVNLPNLFDLGGGEPYHVKLEIVSNIQSYDSGN